MHDVAQIMPLAPSSGMLAKSGVQIVLDDLAPWQRPASTATEFYDTDEEDQADIFEESPTRSPIAVACTTRPSSSDADFAQFDGRSETTISTYDEVRTPESNHQFDFVPGTEDYAKPVEGPRGPHLFRSSRTSADFNFDFALQMSPLLPKQPWLAIDTEPFQPPDTVSESRHFEASTPPLAELENADVRTWSSYQVACWMYESGFEESIVAKFETHDITGTLLLDLQFEDLKELDIASFGKRHELWNKIASLRDNGGRISPCHTPFQDISRPCTSHTRPKRDEIYTGNEPVTPITPSGGKKRRGRKHRKALDDVISPTESISIVAIEQLLPKPHKCSKGENCAKWRRQQKQLQRLRDEHGFPISPERGGQIFIAGHPGNPETAENIVEHVYRPASEAVPSVVASSDILGPGHVPDFALHEDLLRNLESRDPQDNVKQFLSFQHVGNYEDFEEPPSPPSPLEMFPPIQPPKPAPHEYLTSLPKLTIPRSASAVPYTGATIIRSPLDAFSPFCQNVISPIDVYGHNIYRLGTPASEMDVPVTAIPVGPVAREASQSVPPNMQYRPQQKRTSSRPDPSWRRPSFTLPRVDELSAEPSSARPGISQGVRVDDEAPSQNSYVPKHVGWMRKRHTKLLRHEWQHHHFRLHGTTLAMHKDESAQSPLDVIDVDDYAVACSSVASTSKLSAALKPFKLVSSSKKEAAEKGGSNAASAPFSFQLIPTAPSPPKKSATAISAGNSNDRSSTSTAGFRVATAAGMVGLGLGLAKTHHFAVKKREERIDWMRELMLAKALSQKGEGYKVNVNGREI